MVIFLFFTLSKGKRELYLLPLYPAAALIVGKYLEDFLSQETDHFSQRWITLPLYGLMALLVVAGAAAPVSDFQEVSLLFAL